MYHLKCLMGKIKILLKYSEVRCFFLGSNALYVGVAGVKIETTICLHNFLFTSDTNTDSYNKLNYTFVTS